MKEAALIVRHALAMLLARPGTTLRVIAPAIVMMAAVGILALFAVPSLLVMQSADPSTLQGLDRPLTAAGLAVAFVTGYALMAILWHRHALSSAGPKAFSAKLFIGYMWRVVLLALIQLGFSILIVVPLLLSSGGGDGAPSEPNVLAVFITTFLAQLLLIWVSLRLSLILPAAALGTPMSMSESWQHTASVVRPLWGVAAILAALNSVLTLLTGLLSTRTPTMALTVDLPVYMIQGLLIFGVLTTLYSFLVQSTPTTRARGIERFVT